MQYINKFVRTVTFYYLFLICRIELYKIQKIEPRICWMREINIKFFCTVLLWAQGVEWTRNYTGVALKKKNYPIRILIHRISTEVDQILLYFCLSSGLALRWVFNHFYTSHRFQVENISISALFQVYLFSNHFKRNSFVTQDWRLINEPIYGSVIKRLNHINS